MTNENLDSMLESTQQFSVTPKTLIEVCQRFIKSLDEQEIYTLCWNGSLWIDKRAVLKGHVTVNDLYALGPQGDNMTSQYGLGIGAVLLVDFDSLAELFVLDTDEDDDGNPIEPGPCQLLYTPDVGRRKLLECIQNGMESDFVDLMVRIEETEEL